MIPASIIVGIVRPIPQMSIAVCWVAEIVEISSPSPRDAPTKISDVRQSRAKLPFIGTSITKRAKSIMVMKLMIEITKYGMSLLMTIHTGRTGETSTSSSVPNSFSRTIETAVIIVHISISINPITPGTKL